MSSEKPFLSVYGHVTIDQIVSVDHFPGINESVDITSKKTLLGGTGTNIAVTAARLGVPTALCAFIGTDFPSKYMKLIEDSGLILDEFLEVEEYETSTAVVTNDAQLKTNVLFYQGPQGFATKLGKVLTKNAEKSEKVHFCTGEPEYYIDIMSRLKDSKDKVALDPSQETYRLWPESKLRSAMPYAGSLFCNDYEAKVIEERLGVQSVMDLDLPLIVRTDGAEGSVAKIDGEIVRIPCIKGEAAVDPTGCGDSYRAGFYAGLYNGYSVKDSLVIASTVASFTIEKVGALSNTPTWEQVVKRAETYLG